MESTLFKRSIFWFPILLFGLFAIAKIFNNPFYLELIQEDTIMEILQVGFYFLAFVVGVIIAVRFYTQKDVILTVMFSLFAIAMLFISFEEFSWAQRVVGFDNPEFFDENNTQNEFTIHNLEPVQGVLAEVYIIIGFFGAFGWLILSKLPQRIQSGFLRYIFPEKFLSPYFFFVFFIYILLEWFLPLFEYEFGWTSMARGDFFVWRDQEPVELIMSLGFFIFSIDVLLKQKKEKNMLT